MGAALSAAPTLVSAETIKIDGSSTVFPITEAVAEEFQAATKGKMRVTVGISGTGGGFKKLCRGEIDIQNASRPITSSEIEACRIGGSDGLTVSRGSRMTAEGAIEYIELPVAYDALTVVINPENTWAVNMTVEDLKKIWAPEAQGKITKWNQVRAEWPDAPLVLYGAGSDSGTFDYFTEAVVGKSKSSRGDYTASEDDNVLVQGVARDKNALGYFGYAYYAENKDKLKAVGIDSGKGAVLPSEGSVIDG
ncbi:MAG: PstS family phosphate ABC transporter substrate-binding protein, partial [Gammaproteobacteria bacterium]